MNSTIRSTALGRIIAVLLPMSVLVLGACSSSGGSESPAEVVPVQITSADQLDIPIKDYQASVADMKVINAGMEELMKRCMAKYGVTNSGFFGQSLDLDEGDFDLIYASRYGLIDREQAQKSGYVPETAADAMQDVATVPTPTELEVEVLMGQSPDGTPSKLTAADGSPLPEGGCAQAAITDLDPNALNSEDTVAQIDSDSMERTAADPRAIAAQEAWSQCMKQAGYDFATRSDAEASTYDSSSVDEQIRQAVADVDCAISTNYVGIWNGIDAAYQRQLIKERSSDLQASAESLKAVVAKATTIAQGGQ